MPPYLALLLWLVLLLILLRFDPVRGPGMLSALWVPVIWILIIGSRLPSQWLGAGTAASAQAMEEGNTLDATIYSLLILMAFGVLASRSFNWGEFFVANAGLMALLCFALMSVLWSDYPFVTLKRWVRNFGTYLVILVALSDPRGLEAIGLLLRRLCFILIPLSILLNKYFPETSRVFDAWTGEGTFAGATTSKNMLGVLCLVSGLYFFWDTLARWSNRKKLRTASIIGVNAGFFGMTLWLLHMAGSATSNVCFMLGCLVIAAAHTKSVKRHSVLLTASVPMGICLYLLLQFVFGIDLIGVVSEAVGRRRDLTGRTDIWNAVLGTNTNPLVGIGYESFWLGPRLESVWSVAGRVNEAHNGYLEVYLNLGLIGLFLLAVFLIAAYGTICRRFRASTSLGSLSLALWTVLIFYNASESAAFNNHLLWVVFLLGAIAVPGRHSRMRPPLPQVARRNPRKNAPAAAVRR